MQNNVDIQWAHQQWGARQEYEYKKKSEAEKVSENIEDSSGASKALMDTATMVGNKQLQKDNSSQQRNR